MDKSVPIFYFSGTGNTWWVGNRIAEALNKMGFNAKVIPSNKFPHPKSRK